MSELIKCDNCGKVVETGTYYKLTIDHCVTTIKLSLIEDTNKEFDLCEDCFIALKVKNKFLDK